MLAKNSTLYSNFKKHPKKPVVNRNFNKSANQMSINIKNMKNVMIHTSERNTIKQSEIRDKCARIGCGKGVKARSPRGFQEKADRRQNSSTIVPIDESDMQKMDSFMDTKSKKSLMRLEDAKKMTIDAIEENREIMRKLFDNKQKEFYWLPDLSMAGFATKNQIKKSMITWHSNSGVKIQKERTVNWKNPNNNNERHREEKDLEKWNH